MVMCPDHPYRYEKGHRKAFGPSVPQSTADFFEDIRVPLIRSTPLEVLQECPRKFLYGSKLGIRSRSYNSALLIGGIVHKVLQCLFLGQTEETATQGAHSLVAREQQRVLGKTNPAGFLSDGSDSTSIIERLEEDTDKAIAMALAFWSFRAFDTTKFEVLKTPDGDPMVEYLLDVKHPEFSVPLRIPCDLILRKVGTSEVWIVDFKTTSFDAKIRAATSKLSVQTQLYRLGLQLQLDEWANERKFLPLNPFDQMFQVVGAVHGIIQKPSIKYCPLTKDKGGFDTYVQRVIQWYRDKEANTPDNPPVILDWHRFPNRLLSEELRTRLRSYCAAAQSAPDIDRFWKAGGGACTKYNTLCPYMKLCTSDPVQWPDLVRSFYDIRFREDEEDNPDG